MTILSVCFTPGSSIFSCSCIQQQRFCNAYRSCIGMSVCMIGLTKICTESKFQDRSTFGQWRTSPAHRGWTKCKEIFRGSGGRSPPAGSRGGAPVGGLGDSEAEAFSLNYMLILTFLIMKKCNMFIGVSCQRAIQVIRCQFRSS